MTQPSIEQERTDHILGLIFEGMGVHDRDGKKIGKVELVQFGSTDSAVDQDFTGGPLEGLPKVVQNRLWQHGFIRVAGEGLFAAKYYAMPDQIASVSNDRVTLSVAHEELVKSK